jgi:hypothetical protein
VPLSDPPFPARADTPQRPGLESRSGYTRPAMANSGLARSRAGNNSGVLIANKSSKPTPLRGAA